MRFFIPARLDTDTVYVQAGVYLGEYAKESGNVAEVADSKTTVDWPSGHYQTNPHTQESKTNLFQFTGISRLSRSPGNKYFTQAGEKSVAQLRLNSINKEEFSHGSSIS